MKKHTKYPFEKKRRETLKELKRKPIIMWECKTNNTLFNAPASLYYGQLDTKLIVIIGISQLFNK